jgi:hypothetical protein
MLRVAFLITMAGALSTALAGHCINQSKPDGAGNTGTTVVIDAATGEVISIEGTNAAGRVTGGFADVYLDTDGDGEGDVLAVDDTFIAGNHANKVPPGQDFDGVAVLPPIHDGSDPAGDEHGVGH